SSKRDCSSDVCSSDLQPPSVFALVLFAFGTLGNTFLVPYICSVYWRKSNKVGVLTAMIGGSVSHILWTTFDWQAVTGIHPFLGGLIVSILGMVIGNQFGTPPSEDVLDIFEEAKGPRLLPQAIEKNISCEISPEAKSISVFISEQMLPEEGVLQK